MKDFTSEQLTIKHPNMLDLHPKGGARTACHGPFDPTPTYNQESITAREAGPEMRCTLCGFLMPLPRKREGASA